MPESETTDAVDEVKQNTNPRKRIRHRKKQLYENILKQMEFYFSDANLTKDRFLGDLVKSDPYVPLEVFLKFNKVRSMTQDINDIAKAIKNSSVLELSEDKLKVCRKTPVLPYDADTRTVYVESIPVTASREWLQRIFSDYGNVAYISLPKFKQSQKIKGYGFIEFEKPEDAQKCLNEFTKMGCKLPTGMPPEELSSIKMFSVEETGVSEGKVGKEEQVADPEPPKKKKKRDKKPKSLELKETELDDTKKLEIETPSEDNKSMTSVSTPTEEKMLDILSKDETTSHDETEVKETSGKKKKTRKRTAKERSKAKNSLAPNEAPKGALWGLQILSKNEWKALRNKYLNLQRKYMKEMKMKLQSNRHPYTRIPEPAVPSVGTGPAINPQDSDALKNPAPLKRIPGVFVKEVLTEPCLDVRLTKRTIRSNVHALHVDVKEGQSELVIRFDSTEAASEYCTSTSTRAHVLTGKEEEEQWSRAECARSSKRPRGRCRLLARHGAAAAAPLAPSDPQPTHTHIRFDDE